MALLAVHYVLRKEVRDKGNVRGGVDREGLAGARERDNQFVAGGLGDA